MEKSNVTPKYGDPNYIFTLKWHDQEKRDYLIVADAQPRSEVMAARAKGTTVYELIDIYGGVDAVSEAFSAKNEEMLYQDTTAIPEFCSDDAYAPFIERLQAQIDELKNKTATILNPSTEEKGGTEEK